jgi:K+-transporting ATPase ATPase B chain
MAVRSGNLGFTCRSSLWLLVHRALRELRGGGRRGARQGPGASRCATERSNVMAKKLPAPRRDATPEVVAAASFASGDRCPDRGWDIIPGDGEVIEGIAYVDESAVTGESAPVIRESPAAIAAAVTGGTRVLSDWLVVRITANPGESFLDRMIAAG